VPDFLALFKVEGRQVGVLIEVKSTSGDELVFSKAYRERLANYASAAGLPLLVAWKEEHGLWVLFDIEEMERGPSGAWKANFRQVIKQTLMGVLLGDFFAVVRAGAGITMEIHIGDRISKDRFSGTVIASHWHNAQNERIEALGGNFLPLLLCCPDEVEILEEDNVVTQRFYVTTDNLVIAHQTMVAGLLQDSEPDWHAILASGKLEGGLAEVRQAAVDAIKNQMVSYVLDVQPGVRPPFLPRRKRRKIRHLQPPPQEGVSP
jgi:Holliday junction resolvase